MVDVLVPVFRKYWTRKLESLNSQCHVITKKYPEAGFVVQVHTVLNASIKYFNIRTFLLLSSWWIYWLQPPRPVTESRLCVILLEEPEKTWSHVTNLTFQLLFNFIVLQTTLHCHLLMKWYYNIRIHHELTENWLHSVSQLWCKCLFATLGKVCRCIGGASQWHKEFSL
jgi:hypothetical protein